MVSAEIACLRCGHGDRMVGAYFIDRFKTPTAAVACGRCGLIWPSQVSARLAADLLAVRAEAGVLVEEAAQ